MTAARPELAKLACVTVTYHPDVAAVVRQLRRLPAEATKVVIDNASPEALWSELVGAMGDIERVLTIRLGENLGLAAAVNRAAAEVARRTDASWLLLLDQDSEPGEHAVEALVEAFQDAWQSGGCPAAVGPLLLDPATGLTHGFHCVSGWRWSRRFPEHGSAPIACAGLNGSGTLTRLQCFIDSGGLDEGLFIDHVDTEWGFRMTSRGASLLGVPDSIFIHRMGEASKRIWLGGWLNWPIRSPLRHRYLFRNTIVLLGRDYVPRVWKGWAVAKLLLSVVVVLITGPARLHNAGAMFRGVLDGLSGRRGRL